MNHSKANPNVLILFTDQQRFDTIAALGHKHMQTPNLDRLVREGCAYVNAYSPNPVCVPARHNLLTGLTARYHGFSSNSGKQDTTLPTLPGILSKAGYDTRAVGKMHFQPARNHNGFNRMELMEECPQFREEDDYAMYLKDVGLGHIQNIHGVRNLLYMLPQRSLIPEEHHGSTWVGKRSAAYLEQTAGRRPFFLWSSWIAPHPPFDVPDTFADRYKNADIPEPLESETPVAPWTQANGYHMGAIPEESRKRLIRRSRELYCSAISLVDKNVGVVLDALEASGELDNTLIIFASDHGEMLGDHGSFQKMQPYDSSARIPFIVRYPKAFKPGSICEDFVSLNDILPTILDVCGVEYPGEHELAGGSLLNRDYDRSRVFMEYGSASRRWVGMREGRYKYARYYGGGAETLFDLDADPHETRNLLDVESRSAEIAEVRDRCFQQVCEWEVRWGHGQLTELDDSSAELPLLMATLQEGPITNKQNAQFPWFVANIGDAEEKAAMNGFEDEVLECVSKEPELKLHELDLETWHKNGASAEAVERIRKDEL